MSKKAAAPIVLLLILLSFGTSNAYIVDTGAPSVVSDYISLSARQILAGQFALNDSYNISSVEGYMFTGIRYLSGAGGGTLTLRLYRDSNNLPDLATGLINTYTFTMSFNNWIPGWYGPTGLNLLLNAGLYWAVLGAPGDTFFGSMPEHSPDPLAHYAVINISNGNELAFSVDDWHYDYGFRVAGTPASTPEPATMLLFGLGLVGLAGAKRFRK